MVTGDHPVTASAIAHQIGLIGDDHQTVATSGGLGRHRRQSIAVTRRKHSVNSAEVCRGLLASSQPLRFSLANPVLIDYRSPSFSIKCPLYRVIDKSCTGLAGFLRLFSLKKMKIYLNHKSSLALKKTSILQIFYAHSNPTTVGGKASVLRQRVL
jgi:magnesium-transporting ATPase (P-type)